MRLRLTLLAIGLSLATAACTEKASTPTVSTATTPAAAIQFGLASNISSGLPVIHPAILALEKGTVITFRAGLPDAEQALSAIRSGQAIEESEDRLQELQAAFEKLLTLENIELDAVANRDGKTLLLLSPAESIDECLACTELFTPLSEGSVVGGFTIRKVMIENR